MYTEQHKTLIRSSSHFSSRLSLLLPLKSYVLLVGTSCVSMKLVSKYRMELQALELFLVTPEALRPGGTRLLQNRSVLRRRSCSHSLSSLSRYFPLPLPLLYAARIVLLLISEGALAALFAVINNLLLLSCAGGSNSSLLERCNLRSCMDEDVLSRRSLRFRDFCHSNGLMISGRYVELKRICCSC
uniref:Uncharacterized protein n=1 Tax=Glossina pallidipes TaxID=7398 RepID=A0A1A9ZYH7_GLOPL